MVPIPTLFPNVEIPETFRVPSVLMTVPVVAEPTVNFVPVNVKLPSSSSSPEGPEITTLLSVRSPIAAVSAERESMFAVPLI